VVFIFLKLYGQFVRHFDISRVWIMIKKN